MKFIIKINIFLLLLIISFSTTLQAASLDGTTNIVYKNYHYPFANSDTAEGFVRLTNGFTIPANATVTFNIHPPVSGGIQLNDSGTIKLNDDLYFDSSVTLSSGGYIDGQGNSIVLGGDLTIPDGKTLKITGNTIIDGNNFNLILGYLSKLLIDSNKTLTLRNINIKNTYNSDSTQQIQLTDQNSQLALDNVLISCDDDFLFSQGQMFIHNDVIFTGTSSFIYRSVNPTYIQPHSQLYFDKNTTLYYDTDSTNNDLITLIGETSSLYFNGSTLQITNTGIKLTKGQLFLDNKVTLSFSPKSYFSLTQLDSKNNASSATNSVSWSPNGSYLAIGDMSILGAGNIIVYEWNGSTLTQKDTKSFSSDVKCVAWSPNGNYLAACGTNGVNDVVVYSWNGSALTQLDTKDFGTTAISLAWSPDGNHLAVGGNNGTTDLIIYSWNGSNLTAGTTKSFGTGILSVKWSPNGNYLAVGGNNGTTDLIVYSWNGLLLTQQDAKDFSTEVRSVAWSPNGNYLAVGGSNGSNDVIIYSWNGSNLTQLDTKSHGGSANSVIWSSDNNYLAVGGSNSPKELIFYSWDGSSLTQAYTKNTGSTVNSVDWSHDQNYFAITLTNATGLIVYNTSIILETSQTFYNSIIFGDSEKGSEYNLNTYLLSGAQVEANCHVWIDDAD